MVNENYNQLVRNNERGIYLGKENDRKAKDTSVNNQDLPEGPVMREEDEIRKNKE